MDDIVLYTFPTMEDGKKKIEEVYCLLLNDYRSGKKISSEALDWMDSANTWLLLSN